MNCRWEMLGAYVDGELTQEERAEIAAELARDPDVAARVASLSLLKACTASAAPAPPPLQMLQVPAPPSRTVLTFAARALLATCAAIVLAMIVSSALQMRAPMPVLELTALRQATSLHEAWLAGIGTPETFAFQGNPWPAGAPDLREAKLRLVHVHRASDREHHGAARFFGYLGPNGCRLGLRISDDYSGHPSDPRAVRLGDISGYVWERDGKAYAIVARGMDPLRLTSLASVIARILERQNRIDNDLRVALRRSATTGSACS